MPTYPLDIPSNIEITGARIRMVRSTTLASSPFTGKRQAGEQAFALWAARFTLPSLEPLEAVDWRVFSLELRGRYGTFKFPIPNYTAPSSGYVGAAGLVQGANQVGTSLITDGWSISTLVLKKGDYFMVNGELKMMTADATTNGSGVVTLNFEPALRAAPADNAALTITNPYCVMAPITDDLGWDIEPPELYKFVFEAVEAF